MKLSALTAISPVDGRYRNTTEKLANYFSEYALIRYRVLVEIEYFIALAEAGIPELKSFPKEQEENLRAIYKKNSEDDALAIKEIEKTTK